jgi:hypothetical protein
MEIQANRSRQAAPNYHPGDLVWLKLRDRSQGYKLRDRQVRASVVEQVNSHSYRLDLPGRGCHVFHVDRLRPCPTFLPLPSQTLHDVRPPPVVIDGENEWEVNDLRKREIREFRGQRTDGFMVKWSGYRRATWEPLVTMQNTTAYDRFLDKEKENGDFIGGAPLDMEFGSHLANRTPKTPD